LTILAGFEPGPVEEVISQFYQQRAVNGKGLYCLWNPQKHRPIKNMRSDGDVRQRQLRKIIDKVDTRAKEDRDADSNRSEDGGGEVVGRCGD
jgi:hypothetical protein